MSLSTQTVDDRKLQSVLDTLSLELQTPFIDRLRLSKHHGKDPVSQLSDTVAELTSRERDLTAAIGIARMLLGKNKELAEELQTVTAEKSHLEGVNLMCRQEEKLMRGQINDLETKTSMLEAELVDAESQLNAANVTIMHLEEINFASTQEEKEEKGEEMEKIEADSVIMRDLKRTNGNLEREIANMHKKIRNLVEDLKSEREKNEKNDDEIGKLKEELRGVKEEKRKSEKKAKQTEDHAKYLEFDVMVLQRKLERMEEEAKFSTSLSTNSSAHKHERHTSLFTKLHGIAEGSEPASDEELGEQVSWRREMSVDFGNESMDDEDIFGRREILTLGSQKPFMFPDVQICRLPGISVGKKTGIRLSPRSKPLSIRTTVGLNINGRKSQRKDPSEEYFLLVSATQATQAVKFSSPYMDSVCTISAKSLYEQALQDAVPFHKVPVT